MTGPLEGIQILELGGRGPVRFCGMLLADLGAEIISIHRPRAADDITPLGNSGLGRGRRYVSLDLRSEKGLRAGLALAERADAIIEGFLPGAAEKLGIGPDDCAAINPRLVYGRMTTWGQSGPLAREPGHNINALAVSGVLDHLGRADTLPTPSMNLLADGGGAMFLTVGVLSAIVAARSSGEGQIVDASMLDGAALLDTMNHEMRNEGRWSERRGTNLNDSGAPFYDVYATADGGLVAVGAVEERFWTELLRLLAIDDPGVDRWDRANWAWWRARIGEALAERTRDEWCKLAEDACACLSPVLRLDEAPNHPHNEEREVFTRVGEHTFPSPAPRFSRTPLRALQDATSSDQTDRILSELKESRSPS